MALGVQAYCADHAVSCRSWEIGLCFLLETMAPDFSYLSARVPRKTRKSSSRFWSSKLLAGARQVLRDVVCAGLLLVGELEALPLRPALMGRRAALRKGEDHGGGGRSWHRGREPGHHGRRGRWS